jgi:hypothetical integral membrane protein (TIGR02206 family)
MVGLLAIAIYLTFRYADRIKANVKTEKHLPLFLGIAAWVLEIVFHIWNYVNKTHFVKNLIPLELCSISLVLTVFLCFSNNQSVFEIYYFFSIGALMAILFPSYGGFGPDRFRFYHYFFCHSYIVWLNFYYLKVKGFRLRRTAFLRLVAVMIPLSFLTRFIDLRFDVDYMFLLGPSATKSPLDFLGDGNAYFYKLLLLALTIFFVLYLAGPKENKNAEAASLSD